MNKELPDWYLCWVRGVLGTRESYSSDGAFDWWLATVDYLAALFKGGRITLSENQRMREVTHDALHHALQNLIHPTHKKEA